MIMKMIQDFGNKMEAKMEKMQEMFNNDLEELKNVSTEAFYLHRCITSLEKEAQDFPSCVFSSCFMVHDAS